ncbi:PapD-like protein [Pholiota conissans]|uniref:PapD-like protein n=1 Tax=Pholiota conissans TaxID=109636 RepID=A0A9P5YW37_9AGAR|nr:PapD-like protein [Pholiota conissans]
MSVSLNPSSALGFRRPLTTLVKRSLTITNNNPQPVAFKVKTTAPKLYCVRPNSGRVEPGESIDVSVMLQALKEEPPLNTKCKDKFLIQSTIITPDKENLALHDIWASPEANEEGKVFQQKLRVTYLPAEGQTLEEEDETAGAPSVFSGHESVRYDTIRPGNGTIFANADPHFAAASSQETAHDEQHRAPSPLPEATHAEPSHEPEHNNVPIVVVAPESAPEPFTAPIPAAAPTELDHYERYASAEPEYIAQSFEEPTHAPEPQAMYEPVREPSPAPIPVPAPASTAAPEPIYITRENPINEEMFAKYNMAQSEIERLKAQIASLAAQQELRRRTRRLSDADSAVGSDVQTMVEEAPIHPEGVPLQVVVIIALGVFITTYLFF